MNSNKLSISIFYITIILLYSCTTPLFVSSDKWAKMRTVELQTNQANLTIKNKKGEVLTNYSTNNNYQIFIEKLKRKNLTLTLSHPDRKDTTINIKRDIRAGAMIASIFGLYSIPTILPIQFINTSIYKISPFYRRFNINLKYNDQFYDKKYSEYAKSESINRYEEFINKYPDSKYVNQAQNRIYEIAWTNAKTQNKTPVYEDFINQYPDSPFKQEAVNKIYELEFNQALSINTINAFDYYISKYPNSAKIEDAKQAKALIMEIDAAYVNAKKTNDYKTYKNFLNTYTTTKYNTEIASLMIDTYCVEQVSKLATLKESNEAIKYIIEIKNKYNAWCNKKHLIENKRDAIIANELNKIKTKNDYDDFLSKQYFEETGYANANENDKEDIKNRILNNSAINLNGQFIFWDKNGIKEEVNYVNGVLEGSYIKTASDGKTILEKGNYLGGIKNGKYILNYENGKKHFEQNWNNGSKESEIEYDEMGINLTVEREQEISKIEQIEKEKIINEEKLKKEKEPREGYNYWILSDMHECECCYKMYQRTIYKYKNFDVALNHDPFGVLGFNTSKDKNNFYYIYYPSKESCKRKGCKIKCGD